MKDAQVREYFEADRHEAMVHSLVLERTYSWKQNLQGKKEKKGFSDNALNIKKGFVAQQFNHGIFLSKHAISYY